MYSGCELSVGDDEWVTERLPEGRLVILGSAQNLAVSINLCYVEDVISIDAFMTGNRDFKGCLGNDKKAPRLFLRHPQVVLCLRETLENLKILVIGRKFQSEHSCYGDSAHVE